MQTIIVILALIFGIIFFMGILAMFFLLHINMSMLKRLNIGIGKIDENK